MIVIIEGNSRIFMLKRRIEQEFAELFPHENPLTISKLEDKHGYSLSNNSLVFDLLHNNDHISAISLTRTQGFIPMADPKELLLMLNTTLETISNKLLDCELSSFSSQKFLIMTIVPLCFAPNTNTMHNACKALNFSIHERNFYILDEPENSDLLNQLIAALQFLIFEYLENDDMVQKTVLELLDVTTQSKSFLNRFRKIEVLQKLVSSSKSMNSESGNRVMRIVSRINRGEVNWVEFEGVTNWKEASFDQKRLRKNPDRTETGFEQKRLRHDLDRTETRSHARLNSFTKVLKKPFINSEVRSITDYILMLSPQNTSETISLALRNLENSIPEAIEASLQDPVLFFKCLNLIEIPTPTNLHKIQNNLLTLLSIKLTKQQAEDIVHKNGLNRIIKAYSTAEPPLQSSILQLLEQTLKQAKRKIDVSSLVSICVCAHSSITELGIEALAEIADPNETGFYDEMFENYVKFFIGACVNENQSESYRNGAVACVANLAKREFLRQQIVYCGGIEVLAGIVKDVERVEGQRIAAKALVNLTGNRKELRIKAVNELSEEIKKLYRNELDWVVSTYLQALVSGRS